MTASVSILDSTTERGPQIFAGTGLLLMLLGAYMAGADTLSCSRTSDGVDCQLQVTRMLGLATIERREIPDVVAVEVRRATDSGSDTANDTLYVIARGSLEVAALGGGAAGQFAGQVDGLLKGQSTVPVRVADSTWIVAGACAGLGLVLFAFGAIAWRSEIRSASSSPRT
jgi:hypothetical protein